jgi:molecular chaperone GrpE
MGVEYIHTQLMNIMTQNGLKVLNPLGEKFNHTRDEAVETVKVDDKESDDKILEVVRVGYELHGKELRAPKVRVGYFE